MIILNDNPENISVVSYMDREKLLFKVGKVRLKTPQMRLKVNIWFLEFYISGLSTDLRKLVSFYFGTLLGMMLKKGEFGILK